MRRAALFIDFDNFFSGLLRADRESALAAIENPGRWIRALETSTDPQRRWLILRCYLNPAGSVRDPLDPDRRHKFDRFRPFFTQAGVEVIDCPSLTAAAKNGADIRIAVDAMTALRADVTFDEVVIASSDADFTPLLQVVRASDRRITVIATSSTAPAYKALADEVLDEEGMFALMADEQGDAEVDGEGDDPKDAVVPAGRHTWRAPDGWSDFQAAARRMYSQAEAPLNLATMGARLRQELGPDVTAGWYGTGGFKAALRRIGITGATVGHDYLWDTRRFVERPGGKDGGSPPAVVRQVTTVTNLPSVPSDAWPVVFEVLASYAENHEFTFAECKRWSRERAADLGSDIPETTFVFAIRECRDGGVMLAEHPSATELGAALLRSLVDRSRTAGMELTDEQQAELAAWLHVDPAPTG